MTRRLLSLAYRPLTSVFFFLSFSGTLFAQGPVTITTTSLPSGRVGTSYTAQFTASGGTTPYTWSRISGTLPAGLTLSTEGVLSGTPTVAGTFNFTIQVLDSSSPKPQADTALFSVSIVLPSPLTILTTSLPNGAVGRAYSQTLTATGGSPPYSWSVTGSLPIGLSLSTNGLLSGTPLGAGSSSFIVTVSDSSNPIVLQSSTFTITIQPQLTITSPGTLPLGVVGALYSQVLQATGPSPITWTVLSGITPSGLSLASSGSLTGTPQIAGTFDFTVQASSSDPVQTATQAIRIVVNEALRINTPATLSDASLAVPYSLTLEAAGGLPPYTWTNIGRALPAGLTLSSSGVISGTPTGLGTFSFTLQVSDAFTPTQQVSRNFTLTISATVSITTLTLPNAFQNLAYSQLLQATGTPPFTWIVSSGTLPTGLTLTTAGLLQGTPLEVGANTFTVTATDSRGVTASREFTLVVDTPIPSLSVPGLPTTLGARQTANVSLTLAAAHPSALSGQLKLTFTSNAEIPSDDPMTQFSTGSRTASFTIPANTTTAVFASNLMLLTGTVAGTVRLTANFDNGPSDVAVTTVDIPSTAPQITDLTAFFTASGLNVQVIGYAPSRRVSSAEFTFDVKVGNKTQRVTLTRSVDSEFATWYRNPTATTFGSSFSFLQSFAVEGDATAIEGVTVRLTNAQGTTTSTTTKPR